MDESWRNWKWQKYSESCCVRNMAKVVMTSVSGLQVEFGGGFRFPLGLAKVPSAWLANWGLGGQNPTHCLFL